MSHVVGPRDSVLRSMRVLNGKSGEGGMFLWRFMGKLLARVTEIYGSNIDIDRSSRAILTLDVTINNQRNLAFPARETKS